MDLLQLVEENKLSLWCGFYSEDVDSVTTALGKKRDQGINPNPPHGVGLTQT